MLSKIAKSAVLGALTGCVGGYVLGWMLTFPLAEWVQSSIANATMYTVPNMSSGLGALLGLAVGAMTPITAAAKARRDQDDNRERDIRRAHAVDSAQQEQRYADLLLLVAESVRTLEQLLASLEATERALDHASEAFAERSFAPFWDSIESAMDSLGMFDACVARISRNATRHGAASVGLSREAPPFPVTVAAIPAIAVGRSSSSRLRALIRQAQRDFQFATIYEQRRTNHILLAGFTSLGSAVEGLGQRMEHSLERLRDTIVSTNADVVSSIEQVGLDVNLSLEAGRVLDDENTAAMQQRADHALVMLNNIQWRRRPGL